MKKQGSLFLRRTEVLVVNSSPDQVKHGAEALLQSLTPSNGFYRHPMMTVIPGKVSSDGFELVFRRSFPQHFAPYIKSTFGECSSGTMIMFSFRLQPQTNFFILLTSFIGLFTSILFMFVANQLIIGLAIWLALLLVYLFISYQFTQLCNEASSFIAEHFHDLSNRTA